MQQNIQLRTINLKIFFLSFLFVFPLVGLIALFAKKISYTTNQTYFLILSLSFIFIVVCLVFKISMKRIEVSFEKDHLLLINKKTEQIKKTLFKEIKNYNIYYLSIKKAGYLLRIKTNKNICFWIIRDINEDRYEYHENLKRLDNEFISHNLSIKKKSNYLDYLILFLACLPLVILIIGILSIISIFYYIFFMI